MARHSVLCAALLAACSFAVPARADWPHTSSLSGVPCGADGGSQGYVAAAPDGAGGAFVAWVDGARTGVAVQRVSSAGIPLWGSAGLMANTTGRPGSAPAIVQDGSGGAIVCWESGPSPLDVYAQRFDAGGTPQWTAGGVALSGSSSTKTSVSAAPDGLGGAYVSWTQSTTVHGVAGTPLVMVQHVDGSGTRLWGTGLGVTSTGDSQGADAMTSDGAGGAIVAWAEVVSGTSHIFAQRYNSAGTAQWTANGVSVCALTSGGQFLPVIVGDGAGGALVAWSDYRFTSSEAPFAQHLGATGASTWFVLGVQLTSASSYAEATSIATDDAGGAIVSVDYASDIYAQRVDASGTRQWGTSIGAPLCTDPGLQQSSRLVSDGAGGAEVVWWDNRNLNTGDLYFGRVNSAGTTLGAADGTPLAVSGTAEPPMAIVGDARGGAIVAWPDARTGTAEVLAQRGDSLLVVGDASPRITGVRDVPNDQGGHVKVSWTASVLDANPVPGILDYLVFRRVSPTSWALVDSVPSGPLPQYGAVVASSGDSTAGSAPESVYRVLARTGASPATASWYSDPNSGRSIDNLAPLPPAPLTGTYAAGRTVLQWSAGREADLAGVRIYRGTTAAFTPSPATFLAATTSDQFVDDAGAPYVYQLTAVDVHGNASAPATFVPATRDAFGPSPAAALELAPPGPNPAAEHADLAFSLPFAGHASVVAYDLEGRAVRTLANGVLDAGAHALEWDLTDDRGERVPPGLYLVRLRSGPGQVIRRLAVVR